MGHKYLCMDVGESSIKYAIIDDELNVSTRGELPTPYDGLEKYLSTLTDIFESCKDKVSGIAMSMPGVIDSHNGICITGGSLKAFTELLPLSRILEERCHVPVTIINDAKSAALAEVTWGSLADCQDAVVIMLGTGIGGALIKDGEVHMGKHFSAGEFSWLMMRQDLDMTRESWALHNGNQRLVSLAAAAKGLPPDGLTSCDVFRWCEEGDESALWALDKFTKDVAFMIMNLQSIYDPERFAIGGEISTQPSLLTYIRKNLKYCHSICPFPLPEPEVTTCKYFQDAHLIGALGYFLSRKPSLDRDFFC